jgi:hypothetical protein
LKLKPKALAAAEETQPPALPAPEAEKAAP